MGVSALISHKTKNESHKLKEASLESNSSLYFTQNIQMSPPAASQSTGFAATNKFKSSAPAKSTVIPSYTYRVIVKDAEIHWTMKVVMSHPSYRSCLGINKFFKKMFPDSSVANYFSLSKTNVHTLCILE